MCGDETLQRNVQGWNITKEFTLMEHYLGAQTGYIGNVYRCTVDKY